MNFSISRGAVTTGQKAGRVPPGSTRGIDVHRVLQEGGSATLHDLPVGTVRTIHHFGAFGCRDEKAQMHVGGCVW